MNALDDFFAVRTGDMSVEEMQANSAKRQEDELNSITLADGDRRFIKFSDNGIVREGDKYFVFDVVTLDNVSEGFGSYREARNFLIKEL